MKQKRFMNSQAETAFRVLKAGLTESAGEFEKYSPSRWAKIAQPALRRRGHIADKDDLKARRKAKSGMRRAAAQGCERGREKGLLQMGRETARLNFDRAGNHGVSEFSVGHVHAVPGLDDSELDSLAAKHDVASGRHVDGHEDAIDQRCQFPIDGINAVNDRLGFQG
jgi:hypothetical protein